MTPVKKMTLAGRGGAGFAEGQLISTPTRYRDTVRSSVLTRSLTPALVWSKRTRNSF